MINASNEFVKSMLSPQKTLFIKLELFDSNMVYLREIAQQVKTDLGTLAVSRDSAIRRSFKLTLDNRLGEFVFGEKNLIWLDKKIKLYIGLKAWNESIEYVPMGVFVLTDPSDEHSLSGKPTTINAVDKGYFFTDKRGKFINEQIIEAGGKISDAIRIIASNVGETLFNFDDVTDTVPYELTYSGTDNRWNAIQELATLAKCTVYFDVYGYLRLKKIDLGKFDNEPITWEYVYGSPKEKLYAGNVRTLNDSNLYNDIVVLGGGSETEAVRYRLTIDETIPIWKDNPYSIQKIGISTYFHNNGSADNLLISEDECKFRAKFELMDKAGFIEDVQMTISPNYLHDLDDVIYLQDAENGIEGSKYVVRSLDIPLAPSTMTVGLTRYQKLLENWDSI